MNTFFMHHTKETGRESRERISLYATGSFFSGDLCDDHHDDDDDDEKEEKE
jgi:hypothetical protein